MGFLSETTYDAIRDDPSSIVSYYEFSKDQFVSKLGMAGLSDEALMAAWCTVVAYDLTPYGPGPQTTDLTLNLQAETMACANYVSVAWQLIGLLGGSTSLETALGWDDGAVGNHAQMLFSDSTSHLLLDPTTGLMVNGVTLEGLFSGTHYTDYASFYDRNDITAFNQTDIAAITGGKYRVQDTIYYIPGLDNWLHHYSEYQGLTLDNGDGSQTIVGSLIDDTITAGPGSDTVYGGKGADHIDLSDGKDYAEGGKDNDTLDGGPGIDTIGFDGARAAFSIADDGSAGGVVVTGPLGTDTLFNVEYLKFSDQIVPLTASSTTVSDDTDDFTWADVTTNLDADGHIISILYDYDSGALTQYSYDALSQFSWASVETRYDDQWRAAEILYNNDDATHVLYDFDVVNQFAWARIENRYDTQWNKNQVSYSNDSGTTTVYQYDTNDQLLWASVQSTFNTSGQKAEVLYNNDNGTLTDYQYDINGAFTWASIETDFNASSQKLAAIYNNDSGTHTVYNYDPITSDVVSTHTFDADWSLIA